MPVRTGKARVIGIEPASLVTKSLVREVKTDDAGCFQSALNPGLTKIAVIERHKRTGKRGIGILEGYGLTGGAIATTISHDSHNIVVAGDNDPDMLLAVRELADMGGGIVSVHGGSIRRLPLPIAGLMTSADPQEVNAVLHDMLVVKRQTGDLEKSLKILPPKRTKTGAYIGSVNFVGYDAKGSPNPVKALGLEYGNNHQVARPFMQKAANSCRAEVTDKMQQVFNREVKS